MGGEGIPENVEKGCGSHRKNSTVLTSIDGVEKRGRAR